HDVLLRPDHPALYTPESVNPSFAADSRDGDVEAALGTAPVVVDQSYTTPTEHNNPMEPHTTVALWHDDSAEHTLTLYDSTQGVHTVRTSLAPVFGLEPE